MGIAPEQLGHSLQPVQGGLSLMESVKAEFNDPVIDAISE